MTAATVFLIGAGPGDPGLMTVHGVEALKRADVVLYDHEVNPLILAAARPGAELIDVGGAGPTRMAQEAICYLLIEKAREGKAVARLKWGDPFVFDRGGEEALFLHEHGIALEIVPGVPLGIAVPAYAGIPITYPGGGDTLTFLRGIDETGKTMPDVDWAALARLEGTLLCYADGPQLPRIADRLLAHHCPADTPAAIVTRGAMPGQDTHVGTLADVGRLAAAHRGPGLLVVGRVVAFREHLRWFDRRPLFGRRVLVTRPRGQAAELSQRLAALGAEPVEAPMIRIAPPDDPRPLQDAAVRAAEFDWIVFTSANAVDAFMGALFAAGLDVRALKGPSLCAVGPATAEKLASFSLRVDLVPQEFRAEAAFEALRRDGPLEGAKVLLPRADAGREVLAEALRRAGALVTEAVAYRTVPEDAAAGPDIYKMLLERRLDAVTFTSASALRNFAKICGEEQAADLLAHTVVATIGPVTAEAAARLGVAVNVQPSAYTVPALVEALAAHFAAAAPPEART